MLLWITLLLLLPYAALLAYYRHHWNRVATFEPGALPPAGFVSVVVAARNEAHNIGAQLHALQNQQLPRHQFEVIVVDDFSTDETAAAVQPFLSNSIKCIRPEGAAALSSKKKAIATGVAAARGPLIAVTDADCTPPATWLAHLLSFYGRHGSAFIVAPVQLQASFSLLGTFQVLDFAMLQGITAASVQAGAHSMCNGANLAYEKSAFTAVNGFEGIDKLASGDDMLLLHKIWKRHPQRVHYLKSRGALMPTPAPRSWKAFWAQRIRWSSKATYYEDKRISAVLFFVYGLNVWFFVLVAAAIFEAAYLPVLLLFWAAKTAAEALLLVPAARFLGGQHLLPFFPLLQPLHMAYTVLVGLLSRRGQYEWKGRRTK